MIRYCTGSKIRCRQKCANPEKSLNVDFCIQPIGICARELGTTSFECWFVHLTYVLSLLSLFKHKIHRKALHITPRTAWRHSRPVCRLWTNQVGVNISMLYFTRTVTQLARFGFEILSPAISRDLAFARYTRISQRSRWVLSDRVSSWYRPI